MIRRDRVFSQDDLVTIEQFSGVPASKVQVIAELAVNKYRQRLGFKIAPDQGLHSGTPGRGTGRDEAPTERESRPRPSAVVGTYKSSPMRSSAT